ncbi:MAG: NfeD family protein [Bacteroidaceae bacterium]|nr:NfeD family protein [Bacteroidaceae bacterium]
MEYLIIIGVILLGILFFLLEIFVIPGTSIAGVGAIACLCYSVFYAYATRGVLEGSITLGIVIILVIGAFVWLMRSHTLKRIALKKEIDSSVDNQAERSVSVGDTGITNTRLALIGRAQIGGQEVEVKSVDGFLDEHTPIKVVRIDQGTLLVARDK